MTRMLKLLYNIIYQIVFDLEVKNITNICWINFKVFFIIESSKGFIKNNWKKTILEQYDFLSTKLEYFINFISKIIYYRHLSFWFH